MATPRLGPRPGPLRPRAGLPRSQPATSPSAPAVDPRRCRALARSRGLPVLPVRARWRPRRAAPQARRRQPLRGDRRSAPAVRAPAGARLPARRARGLPEVPQGHRGARGPEGRQPVGCRAEGDGRGDPDPGAVRRDLVRLRRAARRHRPARHRRRTGLDRDRPRAVAIHRTDRAPERRARDRPGRGRGELRGPEPIGRGVAIGDRLAVDRRPARRPRRARRRRHRRPRRPPRP